MKNNQDTALLPSRSSVYTVLHIAHSFIVIVHGVDFNVQQYAKMTSLLKLRKHNKFQNITK